MKRRACLGLSLAAGLSPGAFASAAAYPRKIVRIIVPSIAGSAPDIIARQMAERLAAAWRQQVIVENRPGGNGIVAMNALRQSAADGHALGLFHAAAAVITPRMYKEAKFDIPRDAEVVSTLAYTPMMFVAHPRAGYQGLAEVIRAGKASPEDIAIASPTRGSVPHLTAEMLGQLNKVRFRQVSFNGSAQAIQAVVNGDVPVYVDGIAPLLPLVRAGRLRALAITSDLALPGLESFALAKDTAPGLVAKGWFALFAPRGTPSAVLDIVNAAVGSTLRQVAFIERLQELGTYPMAWDIAHSTRFVVQEKERWGRVIEAAGVQPE